MTRPTAEELAPEIRRGRDGGPGIQAADDPDIDVLATILFEKWGRGRKGDPNRHFEARRLLIVVREFQNRTRRTHYFLTPFDAEGDPEYMCPNCVTPWKCNGPHIPEPAPPAAARPR